MQIYDVSPSALLVADVEALIALAPAAGLLVPLFTYVSAAQGNRTALAAAPPDASFVPARAEGACLSAPLPAGSSDFARWPLANLSLWRAGAAGDLRTCGTAACEADSALAGYARVGGPMCLAWDATAPARLPCVVPVPSLARADAAFADQDYWRGRAWAPQAFLVYLGLARYPHLPALAAARADLAAMGADVFLGEWEQFGHVGENYNAYTGITQDSGDADPFYAWGGLWGLPALLEAGF
jgi:hypothetical protein